ncbi:MAG: transcriptional repressor NrdR [Actinobacteria bacterium]|nr:transcriptional repressor NrdR [Actinomycetota bacterium]
MHCPFCSSDESKVVDSRDSESGDAIRRRRECLACERRYTTYERLEEVPLVVVKRSGSEEVFARQKLLNGLLRATEKRAIPIERLERAVDDIENELRRVPGRRVTTQMVGERALRRLRDIDKVAYVRFASVYRQFDGVDEFQQELARLELAGADPLPGEEPLPGIEAEIDALTTSTFTEPPQAVATGRDKGHD